MSETRIPVDAANLNALLGLITSSVQDIIAIYNAGGYDVPTLDSVVPGPYDSPEFAPLGLTRAIEVVESACAQLCASIAPPGHSVINVSPRCTHNYDVLINYLIIESSWSTLIIYL